MKLELLTAAAFAGTLDNIDWKGLLAAVVAGVVAGVINWLTSTQKKPPPPPPAPDTSGP